MKTKRVLRYYCEFCKKSGCSKYHIAKHEKRCTMNPNRKCGFCSLMDVPQTQMADLLALLPNPSEYENYDEFGGFSYSMCLPTALEKALPDLRDTCNNCPACIMAALRQKRIPVPMATDFNFKQESQVVWNSFNQAQLAKEGYG